MQPIMWGGGPRSDTQVSNLRQAVRSVRVRVYCIDPGPLGQGRGRKGCHDDQLQCKGAQAWRGTYRTAPYAGMLDQVAEEAHQ